MAVCSHLDRFGYCTIKAKSIVMHEGVFAECAACKMFDGSVRSECEIDSSPEEEEDSGEDMEEE